MDPLAELDELIGIDPNDHRAKLSDDLTEEHFALIEELVRLRDRANISQYEVAERMGVTQPTVSAFEKLGKDVKLSTVRRYALAIGATIKHSAEFAEGFQPEDDKVIHAASRFRRTGKVMPPQQQWGFTAHYAQYDQM